MLALTDLIEKCWREDHGIHTRLLLVTVTANSYLVFKRKRWEELRYRGRMLMESKTLSAFWLKTTENTRSVPWMTLDSVYRHWDLHWFMGQQNNSRFRESAIIPCLLLWRLYFTIVTSELYNTDYRRYIEHYIIIAILVFSSIEKCSRQAYSTEWIE